jgi:hypothetical protein
MSALMMMVFHKTGETVERM